MVTLCMLLILPRRQQQQQSYFPIFVETEERHESLQINVYILPLHL